MAEMERAVTIWRSGARFIILPPRLTERNLASNCNLILRLLVRERLLVLLTLVVIIGQVTAHFSLSAPKIVLFIGCFSLVLFAGLYCASLKLVWPTAVGGLVLLFSFFYMRSVFPSDSVRQTFDRAHYWEVHRFSTTRRATVILNGQVVSKVQKSRNVGLRFLFRA